MASKGVNKVILIGNLGNDPECRFFPDGSAVANCSIATSESWKDKQTGQPQERTEWHRVVFADRGNYKLGSIAGEYLHKGSKVYIEGKLRTRKWQDKDGQDRYVTEIVVEQMQMLSSPQDGQQAPQQAARQQAPNSNRQQQSPGQRRGPDPNQAPPQQSQPGYDPQWFDDDIPF